MLLLDALNAVIWYFLLRLIICAVDIGSRESALRGVSFLREYIRIYAWLSKVWKKIPTENSERLGLSGGGERLSLSPAPPVYQFRIYNLSATDGTPLKGMFF